MGTATKTVTKKDLIDRIAAATGQKRAFVKRTVQEFLDQVMIELSRGNRLEFRDFGVFETKQRAARIAQNPKTLQRVRVPAKRTVKFKIGRMMKVGLDDVEALIAEIAETARREEPMEVGTENGEAHVVVTGGGARANGRARHR